jgi:hypothetical protein
MQPGIFNPIIMPETKKQKIIKSLGDIPDHIASMETEVYDAMIKCIRDNLIPSDVFTGKQLRKWAEDNGYVVDMSDFGYDHE